MKKGRKFGRIVPILVLLALLLSLVPLAGAACDDDDDDGNGNGKVPVAAFSATPDSGAPPLSVTFTDESTGEIDSWEWDFGDGETGTAQSPTHDYETEGTYTVSLKVTGPDGTDTETKTGYIEVAAFIADFTADQTTGTFAAGGDVTIQFTDQSTGEVDTWEWDFGDEETSTEQNPSHTYAGVVNKYDVSLTATSSEGTKTATKDGYITVHADQYESASLDLAYAMATGQVASQPADKFAELLEQYSGGSVDVTVFGGGVPYTYGEDLTALVNGDVDIVWTSPFFLRQISPCLDPFGGTPNMVITYEQGRTILNDTAVPAIVSGALQAAMGVEVLGWFESILGGLMAGNQDMGVTFVEDAWSGQKFGALYPGAIAPEQEYAGLEELVVGGANEITAAAQGLYDVSGTSPGHYVETGLIEYFPHALMTINFSPMVALYNSAAWADLPTNTKDLINNIVVPDVEAFARELAIEDTQEVFKTMNGECDSLNIQTPVLSKALFDNMVAEEYGPMMDRIQSFQEGFEGLGQQIYDIIYATRSDSPQYDQDYLDMLEYAGITPPDN
ncbi:PKD domain-containing protein [Chloroflexota bacterium]